MKDKKDYTTYIVLIDLTLSFDFEPPTMKDKNPKMRFVIQRKSLQLYYTALIKFTNKINLEGQLGPGMKATAEPHILPSCVFSKL